MALGATLPPDIHADRRLSHRSGNARAAYYAAFSFCRTNATDGVLSAVDLRTLLVPPSAVRELVDAGLWQDAGEGSVLIGDYLEHNPSAADIATEREAWKVRKGRQRHSACPGGTDSVTEPVTEQGTGGVTVAVTHLASPFSLSSDLNSLPDPESSSALSSCIQDLKESARVSGKRASKRVKREFPGDFEPTEDHFRRAREYGLDVNSELEECRLWHEKTGTLTASPNASFTTWLIKANKFQKPPGAASHERHRQADREPGAYQLFKPAERVPDAERIDPAKLAELLSGVGKRVPA